MQKKFYVVPKRFVKNMERHPSTLLVFMDEEGLPVDTFREALEVHSFMSKPFRRKDYAIVERDCIRDEVDGPFYPHYWISCQTGEIVEGFRDVIKRAIDALKGEYGKRWLHVLWRYDPKGF